MFAVPIFVKMALLWAPVTMVIMRVVVVAMVVAELVMMGVDALPMVMVFVLAVLLLAGIRRDREKRKRGVLGQPLVRPSGQTRVDDDDNVDDYDDIDR